MKTNGQYGNKRLRGRIPQQKYIESSTLENRNGLRIIQEKNIIHESVGGTIYVYNLDIP